MKTSRFSRTRTWTGAVLRGGAGFALLALLHAPLWAQVSGAGGSPPVAARTLLQAGDEPVATYRTDLSARPFFFPVLGPKRTLLCRRWPVEDFEGEERDHLHHRGLWFAHGDLNGVDFWSDEAKNGGRIVTDRVERSADGGALTADARWVGPDGVEICKDRRTIRVSAEPGITILDFDLTLTAASAPLRFGDTKEGTFALRIAESLRLKRPGTGRYVASTGAQDGAIWGTRAAWVDTTGTIEGRNVGIAILDHPKNVRHPTWWHVRDYGLLAANPFGIHDFEKKPGKPGELIVRAAEPIRFRYRCIFHEGDALTAKIAERFATYALLGEERSSK